MQDLLRHIVKKLFGQETAFEIRYCQVNGGSINHTIVFEYNNQPYFLKWNTNNIKGLFEKEVRGLQLLREADSIKIPNVLLRESYEEIDYLCLEYIESCDAKPVFWENFALKLSEMHKKRRDYFGLGYDNYIGRLPQYNQQSDDWPKFLIEQRLLPQLKMARDQHLIGDTILMQFENLFLKLTDLLVVESPSLLHGDLWSGNFLCTKNQQPCIFDPAPYYGHREAELAFTKMFGGFDNRFYDVYQESLPLQFGYEKRVELFNLYPLLVHLNLFGASYLAPIRNTLKRFL